MEQIYAYIKPVICFLILEAILMELVNDAGFRKLIKIFCGILILFLILKPAGLLLNLESLPGKILHDKEWEQELQDCENLIHSTDAYISQQYLEKYRKLVQQQITEIVENEGCELEDCEVIFDDANKMRELSLQIGDFHKEKIEVSVFCEEEWEKEEADRQMIKIKNQIIETYGLADENVRIGKEE